MQSTVVSPSLIRAVNKERRAYMARRNTQPNKQDQHLGEQTHDQAKSKTWNMCQQALKPSGVIHIAVPLKLPLESCLITSAFSLGLDSVVTGLGDEA